MTERTSKTMTGDLARGLRWCAERMSEGKRVFCVRNREGGLVVTYLADAQRYDLGLFDGRPVEEFTLTEMYYDGSDAHFGCALAWADVVGEERRARSISGARADEDPCAACRGTGYRPEDSSEPVRRRCVACGGTGRKPRGEVEECASPARCGTCHFCQRPQPCPEHPGRREP